MALFDAYVFVDWSGRGTPTPARPGPDAIWIGERRGRAARARYFRTRDDAHRHLAATLAADVAAGRRVLVGVDFVLGYPAGLARAAGLAGPAGAPAWRATWEHLARAVHDDASNGNDRFAVAAALNARLGARAFWGAPPAHVGRWLAATSPGFPVATAAGPLARLRATDLCLPGVQEPWKLLGAGSVGSQALLGIPRMNALRSDPALARATAVWPFETGFAPPAAAGPRVVLAEAWPGVVRAEADRLIRVRGLVRDAGQVLALCTWAARLDRAGALAHLLVTPGRLAGPVPGRCLEEEGWTLGALP
jgi:hypothetical protein